jgi:anti-anti-sigma factor
VSRLHAWIGLKDGRFVLEDLGSTNGTGVDGRVLRSEVVPLTPWACVSIGSSTIELTDPSAPMVEAILSEWSTEESVSDRRPVEGATPDQEATGLFGVATPAQPATQPVRRERIEGVLILSPTVPRLDDEATVGPIRDSIDETLFEAGPRPRIVVNLAHLATLSGRGIGLLLALQIRLRRQGGTLRLAQASPMVSTAMEVVGVPSLIETFTTIEDAVLTRWDP